MEISLGFMRSVQCVALFAMSIIAVFFLSEVTHRTGTIKTRIDKELIEPTSWEDFYDFSDFTANTTQPARGNVTNFAHYYPAIHSDSLYDTGLYVSDIIVSERTPTSALQPSVSSIFKRERERLAFDIGWQYTLFIAGTIGFSVFVFFGCGLAFVGALIDMKDPRRPTGLSLHMINWGFVVSVFALMVALTWGVSNDYNMRAYNTTVVAYPLDTVVKDTMDAHLHRHHYVNYIFWCIFLVPLVFATHITLHHGPVEDGGKLFGLFVRGGVKDVFSNSRAKRRRDKN